MVEEPQTNLQTPDSATEETTSPDARLAQLIIEDFVVTALLRTGRALSHPELTANSDGLSLGRTALKRALESSTRITVRERDYELTLRIQSQSESRQERARRPLEATIDTLLFEIGKPLPLPVIVREVANLRSVLPEIVRDGVAHTLQTSRATTQIALNTFLHTHFLLKTGAPNETVLIRENNLENDADFAQFANIEYSITGTLSERTSAILNQIAQPISLKLLGFLLQRSDEKVRTTEMAQVLGDRAAFNSFVGGQVSTQSQLPYLRARTQNWLSSAGGAASQIDLTALLRTRLSPEEIVAPQSEELAAIAQLARSTKAPIFLVSILTDVLEIEPDDPAFGGTLQGLNDALRRDSAWLPAGLGRFLLRESVPEAVGKTPERLRPIHLPIRDTVTNEPLDIEMSDDGLEGDAAAFIHDPQWEDVGEEVEVKMTRRAEENSSSTRYVVTYPHFVEGTIKLRRMDEAFFGLESALSRLSLRATDDETTQEVTAWASRDSGLIYGLGDWYKSRAPQSGAVLEFSRDANNRFSLQLGKPDKLMNLSEERVAELEELQERSAYLSLFDLLQTVMNAHSAGAEITTLWAEVNVVRRTTKRLLCSVLSAYQCFSFKQRGPQQILWRFDAGKLDGGFKKNKRKFVRR